MERKGRKGEEKGGEERRRGLLPSVPQFQICHYMSTTELLIGSVRVDGVVGVQNPLLLCKSSCSCIFRPQ